MLSELYRLRERIKEQDTLYDQLVLPHLEDDNLSKAYEMYIKKLDHFDIRAFRRVVTMVIEDTEVSDEFADLFQSIPEYINYRNNFDKKTKEIFEMDGTNQDKQTIFDTLDRNRSRAHNRVIHLFNRLNEYAEQNGIAYPYPNNGEKFNPKNIYDREKVAHILGKQETLMESVNYYVQEHVQPTNPLQRLRSLSLGELKNYAERLLLNKGVQQLKQDVGLTHE